MRKLILLFTLTNLTFFYANAQKNLAMLGSLQFQGQTLAGCWHYNHPNGREYALVGASLGIAIVDISNPANPVLITQLPGVDNRWHEVKVQESFAYAVSQGYDSLNVLNGLQIIDLRFLPDSIPYKFYRGDGSIANMLDYAHSITTYGNNVFVNGHNILSLGRGVLILDISDPWFPVYRGAVTNRYCHDSFVRGDTLFTSDILDGLFSVYDISVPTTPVLLATQTTPGQFNHNTWLSDDSRTLFTTDERTGAPLASYDVSDLNNISLLDTYYTINTPTAEVHNVRVIDDYLINPSYGSQLTIADASRPRNIVETANYPTGNSLCWDADPYLNSGNIIATDMNSGTLYVFSPTYIRACYLEGEVTDSITGLPIIDASIDIPSVSVSERSDLVGMYYTGYADSGTYQVEFSKQGYQTKTVSTHLQNGVLNILNVKLLPLNTGISSVGDKKVSLFPNPVKEFINIYTEKKILSWFITDPSGRLILRSQPGVTYNGSFDINFPDLSQGFYYIVFEGPEGRSVEKFIKVTQ